MGIIKTRFQKCGWLQNIFCTMILLLNLASAILRISEGKCYIFGYIRSINVVLYYIFDLHVLYIYALLLLYCILLLCRKNKWLWHDWYQPRWMVGVSGHVRACALPSGPDTHRVVQKAWQSSRDYLLFSSGRQKCDQKSIIPSQLTFFYTLGNEILSWIST